MKRICLCVMAIICVLCALTGCDEASRVSENLSKEADNFNIVRRLIVMNCIQGDVLFEMEGKMSIWADRADNQLEIIVEDYDGTYKKHFVGLSDNVTYIVEDVSKNNVSPYRYVLNINPKMWIPFDITTID